MQLQDSSILWKKQVSLGYLLLSFHLIVPEQVPLTPQKVSFHLGKPYGRIPDLAHEGEVEPLSFETHLLSRMLFHQ